MSLIQIIRPYLVLVYLVYYDPVVLHEQRHLEVGIADHKHRVLATHLSLAYTSSTRVADLLWQAVPDDFPGNRHELMCKVE